MQLITEILLSTPDIRAMVANVEMPPGALVDRQFSRLSNIPLTDVRHREFEETDPEPVAAIAQLQSIGDRLAFHRGPFSLTALAGSVNTFGAHIVLLDYIQRFIADGEHGSTRDAVSAIMSQLRLWADNGAAVIAVSAVARNRNRTGSTYQGLGLASFRDSSELEFGGDDVFMLTPPDHDDLVVLQQLKSRYGECRNLTLRFDRYHQRFSTTPHQLSPRPATPPEAQLAELTRIWDRSEHGT
jgi:replicative DNA helicase